MRLLFTLDRGDHASCTYEYVRDSARGIILAGGRVAMIHSRKYDHYKFPGGGIEPGEDPAEAMIRETREEAGLVVKPETVREFGYVHRVQKSDADPAQRFKQDNYYYIAEAEPGLVPQSLDGYEAEEGYELEFVDPETAIAKNRCFRPSPYNPLMLEREARILELLIKEGYFDDTKGGAEK